MITDRVQFIFPAPTDEWELVRDVEIVKSASKELLSVMREICAAETYPDLMVGITKGRTLIEKLPKLADDVPDPEPESPDDDMYCIK